MRLPDFTEDKSLNDLRAAMNAALREYAPAALRNTITTEEIERLQTDGIEIPIEELRVLNDGTYVYKDRRVIVYIRDVAQYNDAYTLPRFHLAVCNTLTKMMEEGRYQKRYVVATRDDGLFKIHKIRNEDIRKSDERLDVCRNCLTELNYRGWLQLDKSRRDTRVKEFSLREFFDEFGRTCVWAAPRYDDIFAPPNVYSVNFYRIAKTIKERRGYRCENPRCRRDLSNADVQRFLHAHHIDADKSDNHPANIRLLCIHCHANEFQHSHLRESPDYAAFCTKFGIRRGSPL